MSSGIFPLNLRELAAEAARGKAKPDGWTTAMEKKFQKKMSALPPEVRSSMPLADWRRELHSELLENPEHKE